MPKIEIMSDRKMEKEQFNLMAYAVAMSNYDRALTTVKELKELYVTTKDNTLASIFEKIENAIIHRKKEEYGKEQVLWKEISVLAKNRDNTLSIFAKACCYDAIADSAEDDTAKKLEYHKKVKREFEKIGDRILILLVSAWIEELPEKGANIYEKIAKEFNKANLGDFANQAMGWHYHALTETAGSLKEKAELWKKAADEFKAGKNDDSYHWAMGLRYYALAEIPKSPKERAELLRDAADEFKAGKKDDSYHQAMGLHYYALALIPKSPKESAELLRDAADEFKTGKNDDLYHQAMGLHYSALALIPKSPKERAELLKDAANEFKAGKYDDWCHMAMGMHYSDLARVTESLEGRAKLNKKAADEFKKGKYEGQYHKEMAWHYYLSSLLRGHRKIDSNF